MSNFVKLLRILSLMTLALVAKRLETFRAAALREATLDRFVVSSYCSKERRRDRSESAAPADGAQLDRKITVTRNCSSCYGSETPGSLS